MTSRLGWDPTQGVYFDRAEQVGDAFAQADPLEIVSDLEDELATLQSQAWKMAEAILWVDELNREYERGYGNRHYVSRVFGGNNGAVIAIAEKVRESGDGWPPARAGRAPLHNNRGPTGMSEDWNNGTVEGLQDRIAELEAENAMLLSGSAEAAVVRQSRIAKLEAENSAWQKLFDASPRHEEGVTGREFISEHNKLVMLWRKELEVLRLRHHILSVLERDEELQVAIVDATTTAARAPTPSSTGRGG